MNRFFGNSSSHGWTLESLLKGTDLWDFFPYSSLLRMCCVGIVVCKSMCRKWKRASSQQAQMCDLGACHTCCRTSLVRIGRVLACFASCGTCDWHSGGIEPHLWSVHDAFRPRNAGKEFLKGSCGSSGAEYQICILDGAGVCGRVDCWSFGEFGDGRASLGCVDGVVLHLCRVCFVLCGGVVR